jgi:hypothetical protein
MEIAPFARKALYRLADAGPEGFSAERLEADRRGLG